MLVTVLGYVGDAVSILTLSMMFGLSRAVQKSAPEAGRLKPWILPIAGLLVQLPLGALARLWPTDSVEAWTVLFGRILVAGLFALAHLGQVQKR